MDFERQSSLDPLEGVGMFLILLHGNITATRFFSFITAPYIPVVLNPGQPPPEGAWTYGVQPAFSFAVSTYIHSQESTKSAPPKSFSFPKYSIRLRHLAIQFSIFRSDLVR